jgi:hypothetical protein
MVFWWLFKFDSNEQDDKVWYFGGFLNLTVIIKVIKVWCFLELSYIIDDLDSSVSIVTRL